MKKFWKDYFSFTSRERIAIILLCCLIAFFWLLPNWYPDKKGVAFNSGEDWKTASSDSLQSPSASNKITSETTATTAIHYFKFDPNELDAAGWKQLGIRDRTIQTILNYRSKGGRFRKPEDLRKIWGMLPADADRLIPYCSIVQQKYPTKTFSAIPTKKPLTKPILINQATAEELEKLPGISRSLAARMVKFRDKIGGFQNLDQVRRTYGLTDSIYLLIEPLIVLQE